jgi:toxin ParE1/3/4
MAQNPAARHRLVVFSPEAQADQLSIYDTTADYWGDEQADAYSDFLFAIAQELADAPAMARLVPERSGVRVFVARWKNARQGHRIFYRETPQGITVLRILHTRMNWQEHLDR